MQCGYSLAIFYIESRLGRSLSCSLLLCYIDEVPDSTTGAVLLSVVLIMSICRIG